jgi:subtilisin-like proprotein convertase family protein
MMKKLLFFLVLTSLSFSQKLQWTNVSSVNGTLSKNVERETFPNDVKLIQINSLEALEHVFSDVPDRFANPKGKVISLPNAEGFIEKFEFFESSNFEPALQEQYPEIRSYIGIGIDDPRAQARVSLDPRGMQYMILRADKKSEFMEPYTTDGLTYALYKSNRNKGKVPFVCSTPEEISMTNEMEKFAQTVQANDQTLRIFRLAMSCNGEYAQFFGGTVAGALAAMNATMTRVNGIYEKDFSIRMNLIANNTNIIFTNPSTDPYTNSNNWANQLQTTLTNTIGEANYDVGHLVSGSGSGGNAGCIGCVCVDGQKGRAYTASSSPTGDAFDIDYVAHELGHQFGANHTFSHALEATGVNVEPGSGSTIMGYAGITNFNVQNSSDDYFHFASIQQVANNMLTKFCQTNQPINNQPPTVNVGGAVTIPQGTAFILSATATDPNNDPMTFTWEQMNSATNASASGANSIAYPTKPNGPLFRSLPPSSSTTRYMPALNSVLNNQLTTTWESVSTVGRSLTFAFTARDNAIVGPQTQSASKSVTVTASAGPFQVTSQNTNGISWDQNSQQNITWAVNNTNSLPGSSNVDILLSTDNGQNFNTVLVSNTPNDGSETITVPNIAAPFCRIMIRPTGNIFYAVNSTPFAIGYNVSTTCNTYTNNTPLSIPDGVGANQQGATVSSSISVPMTGTISDVNVTVNVTHTYINDLVIAINHPNNTQRALWSRNCGSEDGFNITFDDSGSAIACANPTVGTFLPAQSLSAFNGLPTNGNFTLLAADFYNADTGTVNSWSVEVCTQTITLSNPDFGLVDFVVYPNPNRGNFTVKFDNPSNHGVNIQVIDIQGRSVYKNQFEAQGLFQKEIQLPNVPTGVYLVKVSNGEFQEVKKIVIQ